MIRTAIVAAVAAAVLVPASHADALSRCSTSAVHRDNTASGYVAVSTVCTTGTGGQQSMLQVAANGAILTDTGPCVGRSSGSPAYIWVPWYLGGPRNARVLAAGWRQC